MKEDDCDLNISKLFDKKFNFDIPQAGAKKKWDIPLPCEREKTKSHNSGLESLKEQLNKVKTSLNAYDISEWHKHTSKRNPSSRVNPLIRGIFHPELCTQAWCKFHEILCFEKVIPRQCWSSKIVNAVHVCEAPGAFICSLNHYLKSRSPKVKYKWIGCTLNPYYEGNDAESCIADDRLIFHSSEYWCFGTDNTGDIFSRSTLDELTEEALKLGNVDLVTADGSFNCQEKPEDQEIDTACLKYTELLYALSILGNGGSFVIKMFTMFERSSVCLLYVLYSAFDSLSVRKPATSKPGNSEVYVVASGYRGSDSCGQLLETLRKRFPFKDRADIDPVLIDDIPPEFVEQHEKCVKYFATLQINAIEENKEHFSTCFFSPEYEEFKTRVADVAIEMLELRRIPTNQCIISSGILKGYLNSHVKLRPRLIGTFTERHDAKKRYSSGRESVDCKTQKEDWLARKTPMQSSFWEKFKPTFGKPLESVKLSLFCDTDKLIRLHWDWQVADSGYHGCSLAQGQGNVITKVLSEMVSKAGQKCELKVVETDMCWRQIFTTFNVDFSASCFKTVDIREKSLQDCSVLFLNMISHQNEKGSFRELSLRKPLMVALEFILARLSQDSSTVFFLPSALSRLLAGLVWLTCQCFQDYMLVPNVGSPSPVPGFFLICQGFQTSQKLSYLVNASRCLEETDSNLQLLEVVPLCCVLQDVEFSKSLKSVNHCVISARLSQCHDFVL